MFILNLLLFGPPKFKISCVCLPYYLLTPIANSIDPDRAAPKEQPDLGQYCLALVWQVYDQQMYHINQHWKCFK